MHIYVGKLTTINLDNGLSPGWRQAIVWTNTRILLIGPLGTNCSEIVIKIEKIFIDENKFENVIGEMLSISFRPQCVKLFALFNVVCTNHPVLYPAE